MDRIIRHLLVEGIIGNCTPDIRQRVQALGGIQAPVDFLYAVFVASPLAEQAGGGTLIGLFRALRRELVSRRPDEPEISAAFIARVLAGEPVALLTAPSKAEDWLEYHYIQCWIGRIDQGLKAWLETSREIAVDLFVNEQSGRVWNPHLSGFRDRHLAAMLGLDPAGLVNGCIGIPQWMGRVANPAGFLTSLLGELASRIAECTLLGRIRTPIC